MDRRLGEVSFINWQGRRRPRRRGGISLVLIVLAGGVALLGGAMLLSVRAQGMNWFAPNILFALALIAPFVGMLAATPLKIALRWITA